MRYHLLDVWRGVACLSVIVFHATGFAQPGDPWVFLVTERLWIGVPVFFVISGYCIAAAADRMPDLWTYMMRRVRRIIPPYLALLALSFLIVTLLGGELMNHRFRGVDPIHGPLALSGWHWFGTLTLTEMWRSLFVGPPIQWFMGHAWTLGYEEQFYLVTGLVFWRARRRWPVWITGITLLVLAGQFLVDQRTVYGLWFDGQWLLFAAGVGAYWHTHRAVGGERDVMPVVLAVGAALALSQPEVAEAHHNLPLSLLAAMACAGLLIGLHRFDAPLRHRFVALRWCGVRCYSVYLVHWPLTKLVVTIAVAYGLTSPLALASVVVPASVAVSLGAAAWFHVAVEQHFLSTPVRVQRQYAAG